MTKKCRTALALALFLALALGGIVLILRENRENSFVLTESQPLPTPAPRAPAAPAAPAPVAVPMDPAWDEWKEKYSGQEISRVKTEQKALALTFDAGANADGVDRILPILVQNDIRGTFFLTGKFIEKFPQAVQAIKKSGAEFGNHSYDHPYFTKLTSERIAAEISGAEDAFSRQGGEFLPLFRSPYGDRNAGTLASISEAGYLNIRWTVDSLGWKGTSGGMSKEKVQSQVLTKAASGAIIMMHLGSNPDDKTHLDSEALPEIIAQLKADGYEFKTLSELLALGE